MIGRIQDPARPDRDFYVPLRWNPDDHTWELLGKPRAALPRFVHRLAAAEVCWLRARARFRELVQAARLLRALCEHPGFQFEDDAINPDMVRQHARELSRALSAEQEEIERLLDDPRTDDLVHIGEQRYVLVPANMRLEPHDPDQAPVVPMPPPGPEARIRWLARICALFAEELTGEQHPTLHIEAAVQRAQERLHDEDPHRGTEH